MKLDLSVLKEAITTYFFNPSDFKRSMAEIKKDNQDKHFLYSLPIGAVGFLAMMFFNKWFDQGIIEWVGSWFIAGLFGWFVNVAREWHYEDVEAGILFDYRDVRFGGYGSFTGALLVVIISLVYLCFSAG